MAEIIPSPTAFLDQVTEWWLEGELEELVEPTNNCHALFFNEKGDIVAIGRVKEEASGYLFVHQADDRQPSFKVPANEFPMPGIDSVVWTKLNQN